MATLPAAAYKGDKDMVEMLLKAGADINAEGERYGAALQAAVTDRRSEGIVEMLLKAGADVSAQGGYHGTALQAATHRADKEIVQMLLKAGASVNAQGGKYGTALQAVAASWNSMTIEVAKMLLKAGADVNAQGGYYGTALQAAADTRNREMIKMLLKAGADVNAQGGYYGTALQAAANTEDKDMVEMLLKAGADVNAQGGRSGTALQAAVSTGEHKIVERLLEASANVNAQGGFYGTALQAGACKKDEVIVKTLLKAGANVNAQGGYYGTALQAAAYTGYKEVVEMLLEAGANINAQGGYYGTALQAGACTKDGVIVKTLLEAGANVNVQGGYYGTALQAAVHKGNKVAIEVLLKAGTEVNVQSGHYGTALQEAAYDGDKQIVEVLLKAGADINTQGGYFGTALQAAATDKGSEEMVKMLLKAGANVNAQGGYYGTALQTAAFYGKKEIAEMLLNMGADANTQGGEYGTALQSATCYGSTEMVEMLLKAGADVNAQGGYHGTALQIAAAGGNEQMVRLLLENNASARIDLRARDGSSLLHAAAASGNLEVLSILLSNGAGKFLGCKNSLYQTPFLLAASTADLQISERLYSLMEDQTSAVEERDIDGQTPLHLVVEKENTEFVQWLLDRGAKVDSPDFSDTTPFQKASELKNFRILCQLSSRMSEEQRSIDASRWRLISGTADGIIQITKGQSAIVKILTRKEFGGYMNDRSYSLVFSLADIPVREKSLAEDTGEKRLFLIADGNLLRSTPPWGFRCRWWRKTAKVEGKIGRYMMTDRENTKAPHVWKAKVDTIPSAVTLSHVRPGECLLECRLILPVFRSYELREIPSSLVATLERLKREHCIVWIMVKPESPKTEQNTRSRLLKSTTFFSTLEHAALPDTATDLCSPLIRQLKDEWNNVCQAAEQHLNDRRIEVLRSRGLKEGLVGTLLHDALLWNRLSGLLEDQAVALIGSFEVKNWEMIYEQENRETARNLKLDVGDLVEELQKKLNSLTANSQELIQLEFNLTSIAEAQKSTTMNRSMKRLSWITFVFLPLMFISSLFGMNVDLLKSNPGWWWYLAFACGTSTLTFAVWIIFKRSGNLENQIERKFRWLVKPDRKQESWDEEKGWNGKTKNA